MRAEKLQPGLFNLFARRGRVVELSLDIAEACLEPIEAELPQFRQHTENLIEVRRINPPGVGLAAKLDCRVFRRIRFTGKLNHTQRYSVKILPACPADLRRPEFASRGRSSN